MDAVDHQSLRHTGLRYQSAEHASGLEVPYHGS
jgi:hypothetical protein